MSADERLDTLINEGQQANIHGDSHTEKKRKVRMGDGSICGSTGDESWVRHRREVVEWLRGEKGWTQANPKSALSVQCCRFADARRGSVRAAGRRSG